MRTLGDDACDTADLIGQHVYQSHHTTFIGKSYKPSHYSDHARASHTASHYACNMRQNDDGIGDLYDTYASGLQNDVDAMASAQFDSAFASSQPHADLHEVIHQNHHSESGAVNKLVREVCDHQNSWWARGIMGFAAAMDSHAMHLALHAANTFTRDLMGDVAGSYGARYFDDLQNGASTFSESLEFAERDVGLQIIAETGGVVLDYGEQFCRDVVGGALKSTQIFLGKSSLLKNVGLFGKKEVGSISERAERILLLDTGYNVSPEGWFEKYPSIGRDGTYITDYRAIARVIGPYKADSKFSVGFFSGKENISYFRTARLEKYLGLESGSLTENGFRFSRVENITSRFPRCPIYSDSPLFQGKGMGLPYGDPELVVDSISTSQWNQKIR